MSLPNPILPNVDPQSDWRTSKHLVPHPTQNAWGESAWQSIRLQLGTVALADLKGAKLGKVDTLGLSSNLPDDVWKWLSTNAPKRTETLVLFIDRDLMHLPALLQRLTKLTTVHLAGPKAPQWASELPTSVRWLKLHGDADWMAAVPPCPKVLVHATTDGAGAVIASERVHTDSPLMVTLTDDADASEVTLKAVHKGVNGFKVMDAERTTLAGFYVPNPQKGVANKPRRLDIAATAVSVAAQHPLPPTVEHLYVSPAGQTPIPWDALAKLLPGLRSVHVCSPISGLPNEPIVDAPHLQHIALIRAGFTDSDVPALTHIATQLPALTTLDLSGSPLPPLGSPAVVRQATPTRIIGHIDYDNLLDLRNIGGEDHDELFAAWGRQTAKDLLAWSERAELVWARGVKTELKQAAKKNHAGAFNVYAHLEFASRLQRGIGPTALNALSRQAGEACETVLEGMNGGYGNDIHVYANAALTLGMLAGSLHAHWHAELDTPFDKLPENPTTARALVLALAKAYAWERDHIADELKAQAGPPIRSPKPLVARPKTARQSVSTPSATAPSEGVTRLEFTAGTANKFWQVHTDGCVVHTRWGRIGTNGQSKSASFDSPEAADKQALKQANGKRKKGYSDV